MGEFNLPNEFPSPENQIIQSIYFETRMRHNSAKSLLIFILLLCYPAFLLPSAELNYSSEHPRIWVTPSVVEKLKSSIKEYDLEKLEGSPRLLDLSFLYLLTKNEDLGRRIIQKAKALDLAKPENLKTFAIVYDWCYSAIPEEEKSIWRKKLIEYSRYFLSQKRSFRSFHNIFYERATAIGITSLALLGEEKEAEEIFKKIYEEYQDAIEMVENLFPDGGWPEGTLYSRHVTLPFLEFLLALRTTTGMDYLEKSRFFRNAPYFVIYSTYPDGTMFNAGDNDFPYLTWRENRLLRILSHEYKDGYLISFLRKMEKDLGIKDPLNFPRYLWNIKNIKPLPLPQLPRSRLFKGIGLLLARSGWSPEDTYVSFRCGDFYGDHSHYDVNSFTVYKKTPLIIDSGLYDDDWDFRDIKNSHLFNYYRRTIAHNTILVYDPGEKFFSYEREPLVNDGGQRELLWNARGEGDAPADYRQVSPAFGRERTWLLNPGKWETGNIILYDSTPYYSLVVGDGTKAYSSRKLSQFIRNFLFIYPDIIVIYDRIKTTRKTFLPRWLVHFSKTPQIDGKNIFLSGGEPYLSILNLLPLNSRIKRIGGPGKEFWVNGRNFPPRRKKVHRGETPGRWRIEISPGEKTEKTEFLNIILINTPKTKSPMVEKIVYPYQIKLRIVTPSLIYFLSYIRKEPKIKISIFYKRKEEILFQKYYRMNKK